MTAIGIIQARTSSSRLPGKVLKPMAGRPMLQLIVDRVRDADIPVFVATSDDPSDDAVANLCDAIEFPCVRGSLENVLGRFLDVLEHHPADAVVRMTADNPLTDAAGIHAALQAFEKRRPDSRGVSNHLKDRMDPHGYAFEVVESSILREIAESDPTAAEIEHVTHGLKTRGVYELFSISHEDLSALRWTVDYPEDYDYMSDLLSDLDWDATFSQARQWSLARNHPRRTS